LNDLPGDPVFVGYPAAFGFMFITNYLYRFTGESPSSYFALDIKTQAMAMMKKKRFLNVNKDNMQKHWFAKLPNSHIALDGAVVRVYSSVICQRRTRFEGRQGCG